MSATEAASEQRIEIVGERRRPYNGEFRARLVAASLLPAACVRDLARQHGVCPSLIYRWRRLVPKVTVPMSDGCPARILADGIGRVRAGVGLGGLLLEFANQQLELLDVAVELFRRPPEPRPAQHRQLRLQLLEPACACPGCGGTVFSRVGQDERELLEYVPSSFKVIRHVRPKLSCRACETIVQEPMPALPIERGRPGPGLIAHVLVSKYCDHTSCAARL